MSVGPGVMVTCSFKLCPQNAIWIKRIVGHGYNQRVIESDNPLIPRRRIVNMSIILYHRNCLYDENLTVTCSLSVASGIIRHVITTYKQKCYYKYDLNWVAVLILFCLFIILTSSLLSLRNFYMSSIERYRESSDRQMLFDEKIKYIRKK